MKLLRFIFFSLTLAVVSSSALATPSNNSQQTVSTRYAGSKACASCHEKEYKNWKSSDHGLAERQVVDSIDKAAFSPKRSFKHGTQRVDVGIEGGKYQITALGPSGKYETFDVERVIGNDPLRQFLVRSSDGRLQTLEAAYDPKLKEWFNVYGDEDRMPGEWGHWSGRGMNWNSMCATCHNTYLKKNYQQASDSYSTSMAEPTVSCEACHGPMKEHVESSTDSSKANSVSKHSPKLSKDQQFDTCATCHSRRIELGDEFKPGDSYYNNFWPAIVDERDTFYPDGQVHDESYEYNAFLGSRMYRAGVRCGDCHDPHSGKTLAKGNDLCMSCHSGARKSEFPNAPIIDAAKHSFHKSDSDTASERSGNECINCHMPQTTYMQRHKRHDHGFTVPDPLMTKQFGIPNACNRCHTDKDVGWSIGWVDKWYSTKMQRPSRVRTQSIAAAIAGQSNAEVGLLAILNGDESPYWRASAAKLMSTWTQSSAVRSALLKAASDPSAVVRGSAARSLELYQGSGDQEVNNKLQSLLNDPIRGVRFHAAWALRSSIDENSTAGKELIQTLDYLADQPSGQVQRAAYYRARGDTARALAAYEQAIKWDPNSAGVHHDYAILLSGANRIPEAIIELEKACKLEPQNADFRFKLALAIHETGDNERTIKELQEAVKIDQTHARAWFNLGLIYNSMRKSAEALAALNFAHQADPTAAQYVWAQATILAQLGREKEAKEKAQQTLELQPGFAPALSLLGNSPH